MHRWVALVAMLVAGGSLEAQFVPLLDRISATVSPNNDAVIRGASGSVAGSALVVVMNLQTGHYAVVPSTANGSFEATIFAPPGAWVLVKSDPQLQLRDTLTSNRVLGSELISLAGTMFQIPDPFASPTAASLSDLSFFRTLPPWTATARTDKSAYVRGEAITVDATYRVPSSAIAGQSPRIDVTVALIGLTRADGRATLDHNTYVSTIMTPTGLPIERGMSSSTSHRLLSNQAVPLTESGGQLQAMFRVVTNPINVPDGYYRVQVMFRGSGIATTVVPEQPGVATRLDAIGRRLDNFPYGLLPIVKIGNPAPPRLNLTLLANNTSQGSRGVTAVEDRDRYAVATRIAVSPDRIVIPRVDKRSGTPVRYDLEPYALTVAVSDKGEAASWPNLPFKFPSGTLTVTIKRPSGQITVIGPATIRQPKLYWKPWPGWNPSKVFDGNHLGDAFQLTTLDDRFHVTFTEEGPHEITVSSTIEDIWGNVWTGGGTYNVEIGRELDIDTALLPGTPLEVGDSINPSLQLVPGVPADVEVRYRFASSARRDSLTERMLRARAGSQGFAPLEPIAVTEVGEYRIDVTATHRDALSRYWSGTRTWGGVVASRSTPLELHGRRGVDDQQTGRQAWFSRKQIGLSKDTGGHVQLAFHSGDVAWLADDGDAATLRMGVNDPLRLIPTEKWQRDCGPLEDRDILGEAPFHTTGPNEVDPHIAATNDNDLTMYAYRFVERARVRVREFIAEECAGQSTAYWRFNDRYGLQTGIGANGDLPNDFKFQFGGLVAWGRILSQPANAIYASLFIVIPANDTLGTRVFPPFQGNGGLPSGGPLFKLKGRDIDVFFHPTAVRPGTILDRGAVASFAGQVGPTLASRVEITITAPSGATRTVSGRANKIGYFYQPATDFVVNESGVWRASVRVVHDGQISTGAQVTAPFPAGDVLGSRDGEFYFYVAEPSATRIAPVPQFVKPARGALSFTVVPPVALTEVEMYYTTTMPGFVLEEGKLSGLTYTYDAQRLGRDFPNLDLDDADGLTGVDIITMSFFVTGKDTNGVRRSFARQLVLSGEEVLEPTGPPPRRRAVR